MTALVRTMKGTRAVARVLLLGAGALLCAFGLAVMAQGLAVSEYTARQIKQSVVGYGAADKEQVQHMIVRLLNLQVMPQADAADALAAAICHANASSTLNRLMLATATRGRSGMARGRGRWRLPG